MRGYVSVVNKGNAVGAFQRADGLVYSSSVASAVSADVLDVYLHQSQVVLVYSSTYLFNQMRKLFDTLYLALHPEKPSRKARKFLEEWGVRIEEWEWQGRTEIDNKIVYAVLNKKYRIMLYSRSLDKNMPVSVTFLDDRAWHKNNTITFSKIFKSVSREKVVDEETDKTLVDLNGKCVVSLNFAGYVLDYPELLEKLKPILPPKKRFDFEEGLIKVRPARQELYVRYHPSVEFDVKKIIDELHKRFGINEFVNMLSPPGSGEGVLGDEDSRAQYLASALIVLALPNPRKSLNGRRNNYDIPVKLYIKTYRREKFKHPSEDFADWPKLEFAVYFNADDSIDEVNKKIEFTGVLLASFARSLKLNVVYVDPYQMLSFAPVPEWVRFFKGNLLLQNLNSLGLDEIQKTFLKQLVVNRVLWSDDIKRLAKEFGVSPETVQRRVRELRELGYVLSTRTKHNNKKNQHVYLLNLSAVKDNKLVVMEETGDAQLDAFIDVVKRDEAVPGEVKKNVKLLLVWYLVAQGFRTVKAIQKKLSRYGVFVTDRSVRNYLSRLRAYGLVEVFGSGPHTTYHARYLITGA